MLHDENKLTSKEIWLFFEYVIQVHRDFEHINRADIDRN